MPRSQHLLAALDCNTAIPDCNTCGRPTFPDELNAKLRKRGYPPYLKEKFEKERERNRFKDRPGDCRLLERSESARGRLWAAAMTGISGSTMFDGTLLVLDPDLEALARHSESRPLYDKWAERATAARRESVRIFEKVDTSFSRLSHLKPSI